MITYEPLRQLLSLRGIKTVDLINEGGFSTATAAKINKDEPMLFETLDRLCSLLDVPVEEVILFVDENGIGRTNKDNNFVNLTQEVITLREALISLEREYRELSGQYEELKIEVNRIPKEKKERKEHKQQDKFMIHGLKSLRKLQGLTQNDIAEKIGITKEYYSLMERGVRPFTESTLLKLRDHISINESSIKKVE